MQYFKVPVGHPSEVDEIFDVISYSKGASVIRMLHDFIGDQVEMFEYFVCYIRSFIGSEVQSCMLIYPEIYVIITIKNACL